MRIIVEKNDVAGTRIADFQVEDSVPIPHTGDTISLNEGDLTQRKVVSVDYDYRTWLGDYNGVVVTIVVELM